MEDKNKDKLKKLKNKKKDVISINPLEMLGNNPLKNNFKDKTKEEIKKEKKIFEQNKVKEEDKYKSNKKERNNSSVKKIIMYIMYQVLAMFQKMENQ